MTELAWRQCAAQRRRRLQRETIARLYVLAVLALGAPCLIAAALDAIHRAGFAVPAS